MNHFVPDFDTDDDYVHANPNSMNLPRKSIMGGEDDLMELLWHNGQVVIQNQRLNINNNNKTTSSPEKLHAALPPPMHHHHQQPLDQNVFIQEDEMTSWLHYPLRDDDFCSDLLFSSGVASASASQPQSVSRAVAAAPISPFSAATERQTMSQVSAATLDRQTISQVTAATPERQTMMSQVTAARPPVPSSSVRPPAPSSARPPVRNFMNFSRLRGDYTGGSSRVELGPSISKAVVKESTLVNPSAIPSSSASDSGLTRRTIGIDSQETVNCGSNSAVDEGGAYPFAVPGHNRKGKAVAAPESEIPGTSSSLASKSEIEPVYEQPKTIVDDRKRKERDVNDETECRNEETRQGRGLTSTKRSRAAEVHNLSERKRRDRINERMKALQELIPRCNKSDKASMLDEAIDYMKSLQLQVQVYRAQMMSMGCGMMPMMYPGMQPYMAMGMGMGMNQNPSPSHPPQAFMPFPNMLAAQRPLPTQQAHLSGSVFPGPHYPVQSDPNLNQPQHPGYNMDPYQQFRGLNQTQPPQFQNQATSYPSSSRVSSSKDSEEQGNHTTTG